MRLKTLLTTTACVAAIGGLGAAPAAAKDNGRGKIRRCEVGAAKKFKCETTGNEVVVGQCPASYDVTAVLAVSVDFDTNADGLVCANATLGYVDDQLL